ncbi:MAG: hypothetical protein P1U89_16415 [Verrucomicrobiales bacterium]|nr:hypothetical protein [Verrucomicrobiales bacterium]
MRNVMIVKANNPGFQISFNPVRLALLALFMVFGIPEFSIAQTSNAKVEVQLSGYVYQGGRKSKRGIQLTTSSVSLPDLNAILAPTPLPKTEPVPQKAKTTPTAGNPRFGYGSGPVQPPLVDPRVPIDPGYDPVPVEPQPQPQNVVPSVVSPPTVSIQHTTTIPFAHGYYPRTYTTRIPYIYQPYSYGHHHHYYGGYHGCGTYPSRAPLRGSLTSSRNYLSGFSSFRFSF